MLDDVASIEQCLVDRSCQLATQSVFFDTGGHEGEQAGHRRVTARHLGSGMAVIVVAAQWENYPLRGWIGIRPHGVRIKGVHGLVADS